MGPSRPISLFAVEPQTRQKPYAFAVSIVLHVLVVGVVIYGFLFAPRINMRAEADRYTLRQVDITLPDPIQRQHSGDSAMYPGEHSTEQTQSTHSMQAAPSSRLRQIPRLNIANRTIVQPDLPMKPIVIKDARLPQLFLWSAQRPKVALIAPPQPQKLAWVDTKPVLERPTPETHVADIPLTSTQFATSTPMPMPSTTTPVVVSGATVADLIPESSSKSSIQPSSAAMLSISEEQMAKGTIALPPVNQTAAGSEDGAMRPGKSGNGSQSGRGDPDSRGAENGMQRSQGASGTAAGPAGTRAGNNSGNGGNVGKGTTKTGTVNGGAGGEGSEPTFTKLSLPPNGQYGVVVVGSSMAEEFPETSRLWGGRLVYSVFLHVGLAKSWILQYTLPGSVEAIGAGHVDHLEAPWPFYIVRPGDAPSNVNANALMIHGIVNEAGHFEALAVVFPSGYMHAQLLLEAIQQWKFRPAKHNGQAAKVEVLLIIPQQLD